MVAQFDPPPTTNQFRSLLQKIYDSPAAPPPEVFNVQEPLPPVPYFDAPESPSVIVETSPRAPSVPRGASPPPPTTNPIPKTALPTTTPAPRTAPPPLTTNPVTTAAPPSGGGSAAVVTTTAGGVVTGAGVLTGGLALLAGGLLVYDAWQLYKLWKLSQPEPKAKEPIENTQIGVGYAFSTSSPFVRQLKQSGLLPAPYNGGFFWGAVTEFNQTPYRGAYNDWYVSITCASSQSGLDQVKQEVFVGLWSEPSPTIGNLIRFDNLSNTDAASVKAPIQKRPLIKSGISPSSTPQGISSPNPNGVRSPTSTLR